MDKIVLWMPLFPKKSSAIVNSDFFIEEASCSFQIITLVIAKRGIYFSLFLSELLGSGRSYLVGIQMQQRLSRSRPFPNRTFCFSCQLWRHIALNY